MSPPPAPAPLPGTACKACLAPPLLIACSCVKQLASKAEVKGASAGMQQLTSGGVPAGARAQAPPRVHEGSLLHVVSLHLTHHPGIHCAAMRAVSTLVAVRAAALPGLGSPGAVWRRGWTSSSLEARGTAAELCLMIEGAPPPRRRAPPPGHQSLEATRLPCPPCQTLQASTPLSSSMHSAAGGWGSPHRRRPLQDDLRGQRQQAGAEPRRGYSSSSSASNAVLSNTTTFLRNLHNGAEARWAAMQSAPAWPVFLRCF